ncbi:MAG UNVERIFIED_CONTAM: hypothetical protein LVR29_13630 [Microcystis novacekii LVE1205-3]
MAFLAAMCASEPCTRTLTERCGTTNDNHNNNNIHHAGGTLFTMLADCLGGEPTRTLAMRASASMVLRAMADHPVGRRAIAQSEDVLIVLLRRIQPETSINSNSASEHPAIKANILDVVGQLLHDSVGNEQLERLGIDNILRDVLVNAKDQNLNEIVQACMEAQAMRRWWGGEQRSADLWLS